MPSLDRLGMQMGLFYGQNSSMATSWLVTVEFIHRDTAEISPLQHGIQQTADLVPG
jgi:hypothetical protein